MKLNKKNQEKLKKEREEYIEIISGMRGEFILMSSFTLALYERAYNMFMNGDINNPMLDMLIEYKPFMINFIINGYVSEGYKDFSNFKYYIERRLNEYQSDFYHML